MEKSKGLAWLNSPVHLNLVERLSSSNLLESGFGILACPETGRKLGGLPTLGPNAIGSPTNKPGVQSWNFQPRAPIASRSYYDWSLPVSVELALITLFRCRSWLQGCSCK